MATLATLVVKLVGDIKDYQQKMTQAEGIGARFGKKMSGLGLGLTAGLTAPLVGAGLAALNMASDLDEATNKVRVVFDDMANNAIDWSRQSATAFGLTQSAALESVGTFGNLFDAMGITESANYDMSTSLVQLAGDLASFNNLDPTEVLTALRSGITGEVEPMRRLGVNLLDAAVGAKALEMGLAATTEELTFQDKVMARYAMIMEQTTNAQGDFARTSDGLANSQRILKAEVGNLAAAFGAELMPVALMVVEWLKQGFAWLNNLDASTRSNIVTFLAFAAALGPVLIIGGMLVTAISAIGAPLLLIAGLVALLAAAWANNWGGIQDKLKAVWEGYILPNLAKLKAWLDETIPKAIEALKGFWENTLLPAIQNVWAWVEGTLFPMFEKMGEWLAANIPGAIDTLKGFWQNVLLPAIQDVWAWVEGTLIPMFENLRDWLSANIPGALQTLSDFWTGTLLPAIQDVWAWMEGTLFPFLEDLNDFIGATLTLAIEGLKLAWALMLPVLQDIWSYFSANILPILEDIWDYLANTLGPAIGDFVTNALEFMSGALETAVGWLQKAADWVRKLTGAVTDYNGTPMNPLGGGGGGGTGRPGRGRAWGGRVFAGQGYPVGERGAEWFVPNVNGYIVPNHKLSQAMGEAGLGVAPVYVTHKTVNYNVNGSFVAEPEQTVTEKLRLLQLMGA